MKKKNLKVNIIENIGNYIEQIKINLLVNFQDTCIQLTKNLEEDNL